VDRASGEDKRKIEELWRLEISGAVEEPHTYSFAELAATPAVGSNRNRPDQLQCIQDSSNPIAARTSDRPIDRIMASLL
jgi:DMSO/TMAO reductase YedYZ molybdopterin-dependent catalytic subunit